MDVQWICETGIEQHGVDELDQLLKREDGFLWVDISVCDAQASQILSEVFGFHAIAIRDCVERNHVSKVHLYADYLFVVLHAPQLGKGGHVHYVELDQFIGTKYLVTVHGPLNPAVTQEVALHETNAVRRRIERGHAHPTSTLDLSHAIVSAICRRQNDFIAELAAKSGRLEQHVMLGEEVRDDPERFLEQLFKVWFELLVVRTMAAHSSESYGRMARARSLPEHWDLPIIDLGDQFSRVKGMADGQREFLHGVIEFYQTKIDTQMTMAAERLASTAVRQNDDMRKITSWVAIIAVPTAITGFFGQNVPYPGFGQQAGWIASSVLMIVAALALYVTFKRKDWL